MKIKLSYNKSVHENAAAYYEQSKDARKRAQGVEKAIEQTKKEIEKAKKQQKENKKKTKIKRDKKWYEKFNWFTTSEKKLAIGGKNAQQNDIVFSKHMEDNDLFFHADIQGGTALILKDGKNASEKEFIECAQFTASLSNAWKNGNAVVDVYSVTKEQLSKHSQGGYIPTGAFAITGKRQWYRNTKLGLKVGILDGIAVIVPECFKGTLEKEVILRPSKTGMEKGKLAKSLAKRLDVHPDDLLTILPSGKTRIKS